MEKILPIQENTTTLSPEKVYCFIKTSPFILVAAIIMGISWYFTIPLIGIAALVVLAIGIYKFYLIRTIKYQITEELLIISRGILSPRTDFLELYRVIDIFVLQPILLRLFGLMTVKLVTFDFNEKLVILEGIKQSAIAHEIREKVNKCRLKNRILTVDKPNGM